MTKKEIEQLEIKLKDAKRKCKENLRLYNECGDWEIFRELTFYEGYKTAIEEMLYMR